MLIEQPALAITLGEGAVGADHALPGQRWVIVGGQHRAGMACGTG